MKGAVKLEGDLGLKSIKAVACLAILRADSLLAAAELGGQEMKLVGAADNKPHNSLKKER